MGQTGLRTRRWRLMLAALAAIAALGAAGCGGGDEEAAPPPAAPAEPAEPPAEPPAETAAPPAETGEPPAETGVAPPEAQPSVTDYAAYVGGSGAADASLTPIKIGYINQEGGPIEIGKTADDGVAIGAKFINEQAGGIGGHPVEIVNCFIAQNEEEGQQCGQQFANDPEIVAIVTGAVAIGSESLHAALAGSKPVVVGVSVNAFDTTAENTAILFGDSQYILAPYATFARDTLGVQSAALIYPEGAGLDNAAAGQTTAFEAAGIPIESVSYPANTTDLTIPLTAANAQDADLVMPVINPGDCVKFQQAILDLGIDETKVLASPICLTPPDDRGSRRLPQVDLRDRVEAHLRRDRSGRAGVPGDPRESGPGGSEVHRRPVDERRLRGDPHPREVAQRRRPRQHHHRRHRRADAGVHGTARARLAGDPVRPVSGRTGSLQRPHPVLPVLRGRRDAGAHAEGGRLGTAAGRLGGAVLG